jgi:H+/Cl- antiporter ClcA
LTSGPTLPVDPLAQIRSRPYRILLVLAALVGLLVSAASWGFLELVHQIQVRVYEDLPGELGYDTAPTWWPLPWLALAGLLTAFAIERLPGRGGHVPAEGLKTGGAPTRPIELPGVLLAASATLGLGLVLGPEAPLIALGLGLGILATRLVKRDAPEQALGLMAASGSFAAIASIFGSPVIGAVLIIEAAGLGGAMLPLVLLPGLLAAGIGSLVFIGLGSWSGFSTAAWELSPFPVEPFPGPGWGDFGWTILLAVAAAVVCFAIMELARGVKRLVDLRPFVLTVAAGLAVGGLAIAYAEATGDSPNAVLFSGETAFGDLFAAAATTSTSTLVLLFVFKGLAWSISLSNFRGGPTFPAIFLGVVAGLVVADLPGYAETQAIAALTGAMCVSILRLPLSSVMIASLLAINAGIGIAPLVIVAVVVAYLVSEGMTAYVDSRVRPGHQDAETV